MIKGINRQVIEVSDTGSEEFERVLLIMRPNYSYSSEKRLQQEVRKVLSAYSKQPSGGKRRKRKGRAWVMAAKFAAAAAAGAALAAVVVQL